MSSRTLSKNATIELAPSEPAIFAIFRVVVYCSKKQGEMSQLPKRYKRKKWKSTILRGGGGTGHCLDRKEA